MDFWFFKKKMEVEDIQKINELTALLWNYKYKTLGVRSISVSSDGLHFVFGCNNNILLFNREGKVL